MLTKNGSLGQGMDSKFYIGELARATDVPIKTIRFYEEVGLLPPAQRAENGYRLYQIDDVRRLRFIRKVRSLDISLEDLRQIVSLWEHDQIRCSQVEQLIKQKLTEIKQRIKMLQTLQTICKPCSRKPNAAPRKMRPKTEPAITYTTFRRSNKNE